jgi:hypothetical protein
MKSTKRYALFAAAVVVALSAGFWLVTRAVSPWAQNRLVDILERRFTSTVEIESLVVQVFPTFRAVGTGMRLRHEGRTDVPPLFEIDRFTATSSLLSLMSRRISLLQLEGLRITVARDRDDRTANGGASGNRDTGGGGAARAVASGFAVSTIVAHGTHLEILPKDAWKQPLTFDLFKLTLRDAGMGSAMAFDSVMTNPKPPGHIDTSGTFGPWNGDNPRRTPLSGEYAFTEADLSVFNGMSGILSSEGTYEGVLERIAVQGWTDVPDFTVTGSPVHLTTRYEAVVDGTSGDTALDRVEASFLRSTVMARGRVGSVPGRKGKEVVLDLTVTEARVEDMVAIASRQTGEPPLSGPIQFTALFELPPGEQDVVERLELNGRFGVEGSTFASTVQKKVDGLSMRAQGRPTESPQDTAADFDGEFRMSNATISFPRVEFSIPGAQVRLSGAYALRREEIDFEGHLLMDAKLSETVTGFKSLLLRLADPLFRRGGRSRIPIRIGGTIKEPHSGLAIGGARQAAQKQGTR